MSMKIFKTYSLLFSILLFANTTMAQSIFSDINSIDKIKCTGTKISGSIDEYDNVTLEYTFKDGKIYSPNLNNLFGNIAKNPKKVKRLKITDDYITFKDSLSRFEAAYFMWVKIDRKTNEFTLNAKNDYGFFFKRANVKGVCSANN